MNLCESQCNICLEQCNTVVNLCDLDENDIKWFTKLQFTVPELEWLEEYVICDSCTKQLEKAWEFKKLVLNLETDRRLTLTKKVVHCDENDDFRDSCDTTEYLFSDDKDIICDICSKTFTTQTQLRQHTLQNHTENNVQTLNNVENNFDSLNVSRLYTCYECGAGFNTKSNLLLHIETEHGLAKSCLICEKLCSNWTVLEDHMKYEHGIETHKEYVCLNCTHKFDTENELNEHKRLCGCQFHCSVCKECFVSENLLNVHQKLCKDTSNSFQCGSCKNFYTSEKNLNLHKIWCGKPDETTVSYNCDTCTLNFSSVEAFKAHNSINHNLQSKTQPNLTKRRGRKPLKTFFCEVCNAPFEYLKLVVEHCISQHGMKKKSVKPYVCEKCDMRFASSANLDQHRHYHEKNRTHVCSLCGKGFITKSDLTVHEYTHYNRRNYKCGKCDKAFNTNKNLRTHNLVVHTDRSLWKYGCSICEKRFPLKTNYEQHLRRHTGEKKYVCHICKKPFISKTEMKRHIALHSNIKAHKCSSCDKEYKERRTYETHLARVHGIGNAKIPVREKKFVCHICPSQFYDRQKLSKHLCSHSGLKPFPCYVCDKKFTDKSYLKHHLKTIHNIIEAPKLE